MAIQRQEVINYSSTGPLKLFIHKLGNVTKHWHKNLEILMVLDGRVNVSSEGSLYELESDDVIVISPNQIHELNSDGCIMLAAQIDMTYLDDSLSDYDRYLFNCSSRECPEKMVHFNRIKELLALMVKANSSETPSLQSKNLSYIYGIISILTEHFQTEPKPDQRSKKDLLRLNRILKYINNHYTSNLSLSELAEMEGITVPYLSTYFKKCMGVTFSEYNNEVKLMNAVEDMLSSSEPISTISSRHGFNDPHSFIRSFKKRYKTLPSAYREKKKDEIEKKKTGEESKVNYISVELNNYLHLLGKHLPSERNTTPREQSRSKSVITFPEVSFNNVIKQNRHHFKRVIGVGKAKDILQSSIQAMIRDLQNSIGFESIKFHGILSDDMHIISRNTKGLSFHFNLIDEVIDFLLSVKLKPIINLSFMPEELARDKNKTVFTSKFITSEPADINEWKLLIRNLITHLMKRYGHNEVLSWSFSVWNEPDTERTLFGFDRDELFFEFYRNSYEAVKEINSSLRFGTPSLLPLTDDNINWLERFLKFCTDSNCPPDFVDIHYYSDIFYAENNHSVIVNTEMNNRLSRDPDNFSNFISSIRNSLEQTGYGKIPLYLTEWGLTVSHRNLLNDTCFKSCYIMKNLLENYDRLDSFGYWSLTDLIEENSFPSELFHGGMGIYTMNGIRKSVFYSLYFANRLGNKLLYSGKGVFVTRKEESVVLISYNYEHFNNIFSEGELFDMTGTNRYTPFDRNEPLDLTLPVSDMKSPAYRVREYFVNRCKGSSFDSWANFGGTELAAEDMYILEKNSVPGFNQYEMHAQEGKIVYSAQLEPLEIRLTILDPI